MQFVVPSNPLIEDKLGLDSWTSRNNLLSRLGLVFLEVLHEKTTKLSDFRLEAVVALAPCVSRVQQFRWDARASLWYSKVEGLVVLEFNLCELTRVDGIEDSTSVLQSVYCEHYS
jgi:hypothetical protein